MKYYINVAEVSRIYTAWEVEASSYEAAVEKLMDARADWSRVSDVMMSGYEDFDVETERIPVNTPEEAEMLGAYCLDEYLEEANVG